MKIPSFQTETETYKMDLDLYNSRSCAQKKQYKSANYSNEDLFHFDQELPFGTYIKFGLKP